MSATANSPAEPLLRVAVDRPLREALDYLPAAAAPDAQAPVVALPGQRVRVPIGRGLAAGIVVGNAATSSLPAERLKAISAVLEVEPALPGDLLELLRWTAEYYHHPIGEVMAGALPKALREGGPLWELQERIGLSDAGRAALAAGEPRRAPRQRALLALLEDGELDATALTARMGEWRSVARPLTARGWLCQSRHVRRPAAGTTADAGALPVARGGAPMLSAEQHAAVRAIDAARGRFAALVLQGATGSGKTEVYLHAVAATLASGQRALVLVPEIGLTPQLVARFRERFKVPIVVMHSGLTDAERLTAWREARAGVARIVIGTRSAVFAPLASLGLIVVDEEHDTSFKQHEGGCRYSARDVAVRRAQLAHCPVVLGSATPSFETLHNVSDGRYVRLLLPRRANQAPPPTLSLVDLRDHAPKDGLSAPVLRAMERHLASDGQVLIYINRRGYAPTLLCTSCGWIAPCHSCDARLTVHRGADRLRCHVCGADEPLPTRCGRCGFQVKPVGQGTERVEEALARIFPGAPLQRLDRDTARSAADVEQVMHSLLDGRARILVGTQMVTKGHHFPGVTLVAVLNADQGLFSTDFRAAERLAQTIVQVAGRAGRAERAGEVLIQSEYPEHPLLQQLLSAGYEGFVATALAERAAARWPPFARIALLRASATDARHTRAFLVEARHCARPPADVTLLGPVDAAMARRAGRHHAQLLIESPSRPALHKFLGDWLTELDVLPSGRRVRWALDVDPLDTQ